MHSAAPRIGVVPAGVPARGKRLHQVFKLDRSLRATWALFAPHNRISLNDKWTKSSQCGVRMNGFKNMALQDYT